MTGGPHPRPELLEAEVPGPGVAAHLAECPACRVDRRMLRRARRASEEAAPRVELDRSWASAGDSLLPAWRSSRSMHGALPSMLDEPLAAGTRVGRYTVRSLLGRGGAATVYRAQHDDGRAVALKVLAHASADLRGRLLREARVLERVAHPGLVALHGVEEHEGRLALALELVEGPSLQEVLADRALPLPVAESLALDLLDAVAALHAAGVVHRDLKPGNVLLAPDGPGLRARVVDLGLARAAPGAASLDESGVQSMAGVVLGTPAYAAPEQLRGAPGVDARADVHALGALLYELLSGLRCFAGLSPQDEIRRVLEGHCTPLRELVPGLPERVARAVDAALQPDPTARPADAASLRAAWLDGVDPAALRLSHWDPELVERILALRREESLPASADAPATKPPVAAPSLRRSEAATWLDTASPAPPAAEPAFLAAGDRVEHFELIRLLGRGGMGEVYLARDTRLGRKVALKLVRSEVLAAPGIRERFLREARVTARFSHPNIVTVYDVGEVAGRPFVALEFLDGESLRERLAKESLGLRQALRIGLSIARALEEAHANDVVHRDLKPENVLLLSSGRVKVVDFGLARRIVLDAPDAAHATALGATFRSALGQVAGTPGYMAPEQWLARPCTAATDVWALGLVLFEMLAGRRAYTAPAIAELLLQVAGPEPAPPLAEAPPEIAQLVARCLQKDPEQRPGAAAVAAVLDAALSGRALDSSDDATPFRGLRPFGERHAAMFVGREAEIAELVERLRDETVLPVVGPSGAGKSSLVAAGVVPRLREQGHWLVLRFRPGAHPFDALVSRLERGDASTMTAPALERPLTADMGPDLAAHLLRAPEYLAWVLHQVALRHQARVLLFIDQLEELYTMVPDEAVRHAFVRTITGAADDPDGPVRVVYTVRDDFLVRLAETVEARRSLGRLVVLRSPDARSLREILVRPVEQAGYRYEDDGLVEEMIAAVRGEPACLPLLQFAGEQLWRRRDVDRKVLTRAACEAIGGVEGALAQHADAVIDAMSGPGASVARQMLLRLVTAEGTRRLVSRGQLLEGLGVEAEEVLAHLVTERMVLVGRSRSGDEDQAQVELVHESLVRSWAKLARWVAESRLELSLLREAEQAAALWSSRGRSDTEVWTGEALWEARRRLGRGGALPGVVSDFLAAGERAQERARRRRRLVQGLAVGLSALIAAGALTSSVLIGRQRQIAEEHRAASQLSAALAALQDGDPLDARARLRDSLEVADSPGARSLWWQLRQEPLRWMRTLDLPVYALVFSPDGRRMALGASRSVFLYDADTAASQVLRGHQGEVTTTAWSRDGRWLASGDETGVVRVWDLEKGRSVTMDTGISLLSVAFDADAQRLAVTGYDPVVQTWDLHSASRLASLEGHEGFVWATEWSPDGRRLATASDDGTVRVWDPAGSAPPVVLGGEGGGAGPVAWTSDGARLVSGHRDGQVRIWQAATGALLGTLQGHDGRVQSVSLGPRDHLLATSGSDGSVRLWDLDAGRQLDRIDEHAGPVWSARLSPDGSLLASAGNDTTLRLWRVEGDALVGAAERSRVEQGGHTGEVNRVDFSPDGRSIASASADRTARVWDAATGRVLQTLSGHGDMVTSLRFLPDGQRLATTSWDHTVRLWDLADGHELRSLAGHEVAVSALGVSPDGRLLASGSADGEVRLWDLDAGGTSRVLGHHESHLADLVFRPDGARLASAGLDAAMQVWELPGGSLLARIPDEARVWGVSYSSDGRLLASGGVGRTLRLWDGDTLAPVAAHPVGIDFNWLDFHPDGRHVGLPCKDGLARIIDVISGQVRTEARGHREGVSSLVFSPDGARFATSSWDGTVRLWNTDDGRPAWNTTLVRPGAGEIHTHEGWRQVVGGEPSAAPDAAWRRAVAEHGRLGAEAPDGASLCLLTHAGTLEAWDLGEDRLASRAAVGSVDQLRAVPGGCLTLAGGEARLWGLDGASTLLAEEVTAVEAGGDEILLAVDGAVRSLGADGQERARYPAAVLVSAVARVGSWIALGFDDGSLELVPATAEGGAGRGGFKGVSRGGVTRIAPGPEGTVVAGFGDGQVGLWSIDDGVRLAEGRLHGPVRHLAVQDAVLVAASDLGQSLSWDFSVYDRDWCELMREVWAEVPVRVEDGRLEAAGPPAGHRCVR